MGCAAAFIFTHSEVNPVARANPHSSAQCGEFVLSLDAITVESFGRKPPITPEELV